jgi:hypothetical protein
VAEPTAKVTQMNRQLRYRLNKFTPAAQSINLFYLLLILQDMLSSENALGNLSWAAQGASAVC